jgi:SEC-C motif-containing protein
VTEPTTALTDRCPCGGPSYDRCCGPLHRGEKHAATATQLMRSRYSAFAREDATYLLATWDQRTRPRRITFDPQMRWLRLDVLDTSGGGLLDTEGAVEFDAHFMEGERRSVLHERSVFVKADGRWRYVGPVAAHVD